MLYVEGFFVKDDVEERFANRVRISTGAGYRLNYYLRFEAWYIIQNSRNKIEEDFTSTDNIIRLLAKYYINKARTHQREQEWAN